MIITTIILIGLATAAYLFYRNNDKNIFPNAIQGTHEGSITKIANVPFLKSNLLAALDSNPEGITLGNETTLPIGVAHDEATTGNIVCVSLLGSASSTLKMTALNAVKAGSEIFAANGGFVQATPTTPGQYYKIGIALSEALFEGDLIEVDPTVATTVTIKA